MPDPDEMQQDIDSDNLEDAYTDFAHQRLWEERLASADETVYLAGVSKIWSHLPPITSPTDLIDLASELKSSLPREVFLHALWFMKDYEIQLENHNQPTSALNEHFHAMTPPPDDRIWLDKSKPQSWTVTVDRMSRKGTIQLIDRIYNEKRSVIGYSLRPEGVAYLVVQNRLSLDDLVNFLISPTQSITRNYFYLERFGKPADPVDGQYKTLGSPKWACLQDIQHNAQRAVESYQSKTPSEIAEVSKALAERNPGACLKWLSDFDRKTIIVDILIHSNMGNPLGRDELMDKINTGPYTKRVTKLTDFYKSANPDAEKPLLMITELICRAAWLTLRPLMNFKINPNQGTTMPDPAIPIETETGPSGTSFLDQMNRLTEQMNSQLIAISQPARDAQRMIELAIPEYLKKNMHVDRSGNIHLRDLEEESNEN